VHDGQFLYGVTRKLPVASSWRGHLLLIFKSRLDFFLESEDYPQRPAAA
jgi:hypothetical protein